MPGLIHIVDDDASFRTAVQRLLRSAGYDVIAHDSAQDVLEQLPAPNAPTCLLLDVQLPGLSGPELQHRLAELGMSLPIIFLTGHGDIPTSVQVIKAGAEDFLTKPVTKDILLDAIERAINRHGMQRRDQDQLNKLQVLVDSLTPREREVFGLVVRGKLNKQIAFELGTTERTIKAHRRKVMEKTHAASLAELVSLAHRLGIAADRPKP